MVYDVFSFRQALSENWQGFDLRRLLPLLLPVLVAVGVAETAIGLGNVAGAATVYLFTLLFCLVVPLRDQSVTTLLVPFGLLALFRLTNIGMPTFFELTLYTLPLLYLPVLVPIYAVVRTSENIRIRTNPKLFLFGILPGIALSAILAAGAFLLINPEALVPRMSVEWVVLMTIIMIFVVALVEELLFRVVLQDAFTAYLGRIFGIILTSILFGAIHSVYASGPLVLFATFLGLLYGVCYELTDSIELVIFVHGVLNVFVFAIFPIYGLL